MTDRGITVDDSEPELVLLCVPDHVIASVASRILPGSWVTHVSGTTSLAALAKDREGVLVLTVYVYTQPVDMRRGFDGLSALEDGHILQCSPVPSGKQ